MACGGKKKGGCGGKCSGGKKGKKVNSYLVWTYANRKG